MPLEDRDVTRLTDMLHYARLAGQILTQYNLSEYDAFVAHDVGKLALVRCIEILGEAGHQMSAATQTALPTIPWHMMYGMRNRLIHDYGHTDYRIVHRTIVEELPNLVENITVFLAQNGYSV